jgi:integrase
MLRYACGYKLANDGHDTRAIQAYLGHRNIQNTTRYTALAHIRAIRSTASKLILASIGERSLKASRISSSFWSRRAVA